MSDDPEDSKPSAIRSDQPDFRFAQMKPQQKQGVSTQAEMHQVIEKASFMPGASRAQEATAGLPPRTSNRAWSPGALRPVPAFYPIEKSSRLAEDELVEDVVARLVDCLRRLSIQALYHNDTATANLLSQENVEMHLSLWKTPPASSRQGVLVEVQRRKGDPILFHCYSQTILGAAMGEEKVVNAELQQRMYSKKVHRMFTLKSHEHEHTNAIIAIEIAHGLLIKDRMDARQLGLESLCLLTDPAKTSYLTAVLTSHAVLLGSIRNIHLDDRQDDLLVVDDGPLREIQTLVMSLVQLGSIDRDEELQDEAERSILHNLALAVLANALQVMEHPERFHDEPEDTRPRLRTASSQDVAKEFLMCMDEGNDDDDNAETAKKSILSTLVSELGRANEKPHDATLSAQCLASLLRASDDARRRAKELGAKTVVQTALDVGTQTHLKLETSCKTVMDVLEQSTTRTGGNDGDEGAAE